MKSLREMRKPSLYGLTAGILLTIFFKMVESNTNYKVYTLLLNIDYIPYLNRFHFPELIEVSFHLVISIILSMCLYLFINYMKASSRQQIIMVCTTLCTIIGLLLFPTTALSTRTPAITDISSLLYWLAGHLIFGLILGILLSWNEKHKPV